MNLSLCSSMKAEFTEDNDGYVPNGYSMDTSFGMGGMKKSNYETALSEMIKDHASDSDGDEGGTSEDSKIYAAKYPRWPQRPEQLLKQVCAKCGMEFSKEAYIEQHLNNMHTDLYTAKDLNIKITSPTSGECQICGARVQHYSLRDLQTHHFLHLQYKSYKCKCHGYYFQDKQSSLQHIRYHAQQLTLRKAPSAEESKVAKWEGSEILPDGSTYDPEFPETGVRFVCPECGENFNAEDEWKDHCNTTHDFKTMDGLNMTKMDDTRVRCNDCSTIIVSKSDNYKLRRHKVTHSPFRAFHCKLCQYTRKRKEDVLQHIRHAHARWGEKYY